MTRKTQSGAADQPTALSSLVENCAAIAKIYGTNLKMDYIKNQNTFVSTWKKNKYDQEMSQSQTTDKRMALRGREIYNTLL